MNEPVSRATASDAPPIGMKRDLARLREESFDLLVIGAGIHGVCAARDATLRGLKVALIDKADLGGATSHNSLKILHGGMRYLQHLNFKRTLISIREQLCFRRTLAAHVRPVTFLMPTIGYGMRGPVAMWLGLQLYNMLTALTAIWLRQPFPSQWATVVSRRRCLELLDYPVQGTVTGGALWVEWQVEQADRALLDMSLHASAEGSCIASYVAATSIKTSNGRVDSVQVRDQLTQDVFSINAKAVINAAGPWVQSLLTNSDPVVQLQDNFPVSKSINILVDRPAASLAVGMQSVYASDSVVGKTRRLFFITPWKNHSVVGTTHSAELMHPDTLAYSESDVKAFLRDINQAFSGIALQAADVLYCYQGMTPLDEPDEDNPKVLHESLVIDHAADNGPRGLVSVVGVKWTTARLVAEQAVDRVVSQLGLSVAGNTLLQLVPDCQKIPIDIAGMSNPDLVEFCRIHMDRTMALTLFDMLTRRTDDFVLGRLTTDQVRLVARTMANALHWDQQTCREQHAALMAAAIPDTRKQQLESLQWWNS